MPDCALAIRNIVETPSPPHRSTIPSVEYDNVQMTMDIIESTCVAERYHAAFMHMADVNNETITAWRKTPEL